MEYHITTTTLEADEAVELVLERLLQRAKELREDPHIVGPVMFVRLHEAIECELVLVRATRGANA